MAEIKISALPEATTSATADSIPIVQAGVTKRIHPGPGGGLDAGLCSAFGIGVVPSSLTAFDAVPKVNGIYICSGTGAPGGFVSEAFEVVVTMYNSTSGGNGNCEAWSCDTHKNYKWTRTLSNGTWEATWTTIWTGLSDGNGGQPPAPKPSIAPAGGTDSPGQQISSPGVDNTAWVLPAGGKWMYWFLRTNNTSPFTLYYHGFGLSAGGATIAAAGGSGQYNYGMAWRTE